MLWPLSFTMNRILFIFLSALICGCHSPDSKELLEYKGPVSEVENVELYYSENDKVKVKMVADLLYTFENEVFLNEPHTHSGQHKFLKYGSVPGFLFDAMGK